jgi:1,2-diacylglycerol 3-alpha-glucosyltransferase
MRIVHVTGYFSVSMAYQENLLPVGQFELGHEVFVLTGVNEPDFGFNRDKRTSSPGSFDYKGVTVCRLPHYIEIINKGPILKGLLRQIRALRPDVLFIHDVGSSFFAGLWYKILNPHVRLQFDCHSTHANARNSKFGPLFHGVFKLFFQVFRRRFDRIFAVSPETVDFMCQYYGLRAEEITLLPLPGDPSLLPLAEEIRTRVRAELAIPQNGQVLIHTGKLPADKETVAVLQAFAKTDGAERRLLIAGWVDDDFMQIFRGYLQADPRVIYLGWTKADRLRELFLASDLLVQPGSLSNTFIDAICSGLPVLLDDTPQGRYLTARNNGRVVQRGQVDLLAARMRECLEADLLPLLKLNARDASEFFGYVNNAKITVNHLE